MQMIDVYQLPNRKALTMHRTLTITILLACCLFLAGTARACPQGSAEYDTGHPAWPYIYSAYHDLEDARDDLIE